jgi:hypothetical protein
VPEYCAGTDPSYDERGFDSLPGETNAISGLYLVRPLHFRFDAYCARRRIHPDGRGCDYSCRYARYWSIPIEDVASVEVRTYGQQYGSVYLERCKAGRGEPRRRPINIKTGNASIWLSLPSSWPALVGFYGFRNFDAFANLIVGLRDGAQLRGDEGRGGFDAVASPTFPTGA